MKIDVAIIGGGVAGCATALALQTMGCQTILVERSTYGTTRVSEHLSPDVRPYLVELGLWEQFLSAGHRPSPGTRYSWDDSDINYYDYIFNPFGHGWNLDRRNFDAMLVDAAESAGAMLLQKARPLTLNERKQGWCIELNVAGAHTEIKAAFLVDATGRSSAVARKLGSKRTNYDRLIGIVGWLSPSSLADRSDAALLVEAVEQGWWYSALLPDDRLIAAFMSDSDLVLGGSVRPQLLWTEHHRRAFHTRMRASGFDLPAKVQIRSANSYRRKRFTGQNWLALAEAAAGYDPLSSMGLVRALQAALIGAQTICNHLSGDGGALKRYEAQARVEFETYLSQRADYYGRVNRWPNSDFWRRRQATAEVLTR